MNEFIMPVGTIEGLRTMQSGVRDWK